MAHYLGLHCLHCAYRQLRDRTFYVITSAHRSWVPSFESICKQTD